MVTAKTLEKAILYAAKAHEGQTRKGDGRPYILHPITVMVTILNIKKSTNPYLLATAAILHDVVEDCWKDRTDGEKLDEISREFGYAVASLVEELTLDKNMYDILGKKEYLAREMMHMTSYALAIKLCDRLSNVSDLHTMSEKFRSGYLEETKFILERIKGRELTKTHKKLVNLIETELRKYTPREMKASTRYE